ncbi:hypothetical protein AKO1_008694 [Acrasis kona]|uniref:Protein kinase domain-containing protein n=1 Tax=Acrasis kona TaxID=1008807 RepID=A0AAW2ZDG3_9EUKA
MRYDILKVEKVLKQKFISKESLIQIRDEVRTIRGLEQDGITFIEAAFVENGHIYIQLPCFSRKSLIEWLESNTVNKSEFEIRSMMKSMVSGIGYIHELYYNIDLKMHKKIN